jgi:hypothetical protein
MKKLAFVFLAVFVSVSAFAQEAFFQKYIDECVGLLGKPVPVAGFQRVSQNTWLRDSDNTALVVENNVVIFSNFGYYHQDIERVENFNSIVWGILMKTGWKFYYYFDSGYAVYLKNGIYAGILEPTKRNDENYATVIGFCKDLRFFNY